MRLRSALALSAAATALAPLALAVPAAASAPALSARPALAGLPTTSLPALRAIPVLPAPAVTVAAARPAPVPRDVSEGSGPQPAPALPARVQPRCGDGKSTRFPLGARIRGGPPVYRSGGGAQTWYLDLTNSTGDHCRAVHPVVVFSDRDRTLTSDRLRMEFVDRGRVYPVTLEDTDQDEVVAVFDGGGEFPGFALGPQGSVTVPVRLSFTADTPPGELVADAALVQRKGDDGDWVGEAGGYRFTVENPEEPVEAGAAGALARTGRTDTLHALAGGAAGAAAAGAALLLTARRLRRTPTR
ncbi:hypothetical protein [Streptomyces sp. NPDC097619]|uniref:hypothetical protein n=1 Tax=Streptomyces sp. NPDC097619 TaxID=3157228 RepID=UPI0033307DA5